MGLQQPVNCTRGYWSRYKVYVYIYVNCVEGSVLSQLQEKGSTCFAFMTTTMHLHDKRNACLPKHE